MCKKLIFKIKIIIVLSLAQGLTACSQTPASLIKLSAGEMSLIDRVNIKRQHQFIIPSISHVAWHVETLPESNSAFDENLHTSLIEDGIYTFGHTFKQVSNISSSDKIRSQQVDFLVKARLVDARVRVRPLVEETIQPRMPRLLPYTALMTLELIDARSDRTIDVAIVEARSGVLGSSKFNHLIRQGLRAYVKSLTYKHKQVY